MWTIVCILSRNTEAVARMGKPISEHNVLFETLAAAIENFKPPKALPKHRTNCLPKFSFDIFFVSYIFHSFGFSGIYVGTDGRALAKNMIDMVAVRVAARKHAGSE